MSRRKSRYQEIVIRIVPLYARLDEGVRAFPAAETSAKAPDNFLARIFKWLTSLRDGVDPSYARTYDAYVYTDLPIPGLDETVVSACGSEKQIGYSKLAGCGQLIVHWENYQRYLHSFISGERVAYKRFWRAANSGGLNTDVVKVRDQLFEIPNVGLKELFSGKLHLTERSLRVWLHCSPPELADLPWELLACELRQKEKTRFSFVRGLPSESVPKVPVTGKLRLAFIHDPKETPVALIRAIEGLRTTLDVVEMHEPPRQALKRAASEGFELVHLVTDGAVSLGHGGLLYLRESSAEASTDTSLGVVTRRFYRLALDYADVFRHLVKEQRLIEWNNKLIDKLDIETCSAEDLGSILRGSRVTLLSFSTPKTDDADPGRFDGSLLPTVYSAFASLGNSSLLPNVVAPLGACDDQTLEAFWSSFYSQLMKPTRPTERGVMPSFSLEEAMAVGLEAAPTALLALFLRQRLGREFTNSIFEIGGEAEEPTRVNAKLQVERNLIEWLRAIDSNYMDIESKVSETPLVQAEAERQTRLEYEIDSFAELEEEEL